MLIVDMHDVMYNKNRRLLEDALGVLGKFTPKGMTAAAMLRQPGVAAAVLRHLNPGKKSEHRAASRLCLALLSTMTVDGEKLQDTSPSTRVLKFGSTEYTVSVYRLRSRRGSPYLWSVVQKTGGVAQAVKPAAPSVAPRPPAREVRAELHENITSMINMLVADELAATQRELTLRLEEAVAELSKLREERQADIARALEEGMALGRTEVRQALRSILE